MSKAVKVNRISLIKRICRKVGISTRVKDAALYLTKPELLRVSSYLDAANDKLKSHQDNTDDKD